MASTGTTQCRQVRSSRPIRTANAEAVATPERLFSEETILALLNTIRWAMGHRVAWNVNQGVKGMMESVVRERPD